MELVRRIFSKFTQQKDSVTEKDILGMMERFGLIAESSTSPNDVNYFVPAQLRNPSPEDLCEEVSSWDPCPLYVNFPSGYVPHGFFSQLISRCIRWCFENECAHQPKLYDCAAQFFIGNSKRVTHHLTLVCKKRFIKIIARHEPNAHEASMADEEELEVGGRVREFLESTLKDMKLKLPWLSNLLYELSVACPLCPKRKCKKHHRISCTHEDCLCLQEMVPPGEQLFCRESGASFGVPQKDYWFSSRTMPQV